MKNQNTYEKIIDAWDFYIWFIIFIYQKYFYLNMIPCILKIGNNQNYN